MPELLPRPALLPTDHDAPLQVVRAMREGGRVDPATELQVRCVELHSYSEGGARPHSHARTDAAVPVNTRQAFGDPPQERSTRRCTATLARCSPCRCSSARRAASREATLSPSERASRRGTASSKAAAPTHPRSLRRPPESPRPALRAAGDGVLLSSMELHNVTRVTRGTRVSLVVELWSEPANSHDRFE